MFYCEQCRRAKAWPESEFRWVGECEMCEARRTCHYVPSRHLPQFPRPLEE